MYVYDTYHSVPKYTTVFMVVYNQMVPYILEQVGTYVRVYFISRFIDVGLSHLLRVSDWYEYARRLASCWSSDQRPNDEEDRRRHRQ